VCLVDEAMVPGAPSEDPVRHTRIRGAVRGPGALSEGLVPPFKDPVHRPRTMMDAQAQLHIGSKDNKSARMDCQAH
jgi:hypothetical protein